MQKLNEYKGDDSTSQATVYLHKNKYIVKTQPGLEQTFLTLVEAETYALAWVQNQDRKIVEIDGVIHLRPSLGLGK